MRPFYGEKMEQQITASVEQSTESSEPANVFAFAPQAVSAPEEGEVKAEQAGDEAPVATEQTGSEEEPSGGVADRKVVFKNQREAGSAFVKERQRRDAEIQRAREELRNDPIYRLGQSLVKDLVDAEGKTEEEAIQIAGQRLIDAIAKREGVGRGVAKMMFERSMAEAPADAPEQAEPEAAQTVQGIVNDLMSIKTLPAGFDMDGAVADQSFQELLLEMPANAAVRVYAAERKAQSAPAAVADRLRARQEIPQTTRPTQAVNAAPDYRSMSDADFLAEKERAKRLIE